MRTFIGAVLVLLICFAGMTVLLATDGTENQVAIHADASAVFSFAPMDTVTLMIPISNLSRRDAEIAGASTSCNISRIQYPSRLRGKGRYWAIATLLVPPAEGDFNEAFVFRLDDGRGFAGADIPYMVDARAPRQDTIFLAYSKRNARRGPGGEYLFLDVLNSRSLR